MLTSFLLPKLTGGDYEILVVGAKTIDMSKVVKNASQLNLPEEKLLGDCGVCIPGFTFDKYRQLQRSRLSIFSINCFGGTLSHNLSLCYRSPFRLLFLNNEDFIKFLKKPRTYMKKELVFDKFNKPTSYAPKGFPVATLGDLSLNMVHYKTFKDSFESWQNYKKKINWDNIFVVTWTVNPEVLEQFDKLPYEKKACFVPFKSDLDSAWYINPEIDKEAPRSVDQFLNFGRCKYIYYDPFDMLLYGKKTPLIDM